MEIKTIYGVEFEVHKGGKIEGDFVYKGKNIYIEGDLEVTGRFECERFKITGSVKVAKSYIVNKWEEVGGSQKVGEYQEVGWSQKVGGYQKVGEYQKVGGDSIIKLGTVVMLSMTIKGKLAVGKRIFAGICNWGDASDEDMKITCQELVSGEVVHGELVETGIKKK